MQNGAELNIYYDLIKKYIDGDIERWDENLKKFGSSKKLRPSELKDYLSGKMRSRFFEKHKLVDVAKIDRVLDDLLGEMVGMEEDGIMTFESYLSSQSGTDMSEQDIMTGLVGAGLAHEKVLADYFDVSLSAIDCVSNVGHHFKIAVPGMEKECVIILSDEIGPVKENLLKLITGKLSGMSVGLDLSGTIVNIPLKNIISEDKLKDKIEMIDSTNLDNWLGVILGGITERDGDNRIVIL